MEQALLVFHLLVENIWNQKCKEEDFVTALQKAAQIKAILYLFRRQMMGESVTCQDIADATGYDREDIVDAMIFWQDRGVTVKDTEEIITFTPIVPEKKEPPKPKTKKEKAQKEKIVVVIPVT